jgi:hypothetical protein
VEFVGVSAWGTRQPLPDGGGEPLHWVYHVVVAADVVHASLAHHHRHIHRTGSPFAQMPNGIWRLLSFSSHGPGRHLTSSSPLHQAVYTLRFLPKPNSHIALGHTPNLRLRSRAGAGWRRGRGGEGDIPHFMTSRSKVRSNVFFPYAITTHNLKNKHCLNQACRTDVSRLCISCANVRMLP